MQNTTNDRSAELNASDCSLPDPTKYPGILSRRNKTGTTMSKEDWIEG